jgi:Transposase Tn5 dimerisation domain
MVTICAPRLGPERKHEPIQGWCIRSWEETPPEGVEALEWILLTTVPVSDQRSAVEQAEWYSSRWTIEEYHKCVKTGCAMEQRQLETAAGLLTLLGFLAIVAVRLLQLRELSRRAPDIAARTAVPAMLVHVLVRRLKLKVEAEELTAREFWRGVARLGGFLGRKGDGNPGWQTLWRGWQRLQDLSWGAP